MTKEARNYLLKGEILAGLQTYEQDSAPIFPLSNSVASYPGSTASTFIATARIAGLFLLTPQWAVGASSTTARPQTIRNLRRLPS